MSESKRIEIQTHSARDYLSTLLPVDVLTAIYSSISLVLILWRREAIGEHAWRYARYHLFVILLALVIAPAIDRIPALLNNRFVRFLRYWYPGFLWGFMYNWTEPVNRMFFAKPFDDILIAADKYLFGFEPADQLAPMVNNNYWLTEYLTAAYVGYYLLLAYLPLYLYFTGRLKEFLHTAFILSLVFYSCYLVFQIFPAEGPIYYKFGGEHLKAGPISAFAEAFLSRADIPGAAFPSSHVAAALTILFLAFKYWRKAFYITLPFVLSLWVATVYCRFHYAVDGIAGFFVAIIWTYYIGPLVYSWFYKRFCPLHLRKLLWQDTKHGAAQPVPIKFGL